MLGDWLYVYSGHTGATHKYHNGTTTKHFRRLNLKDRQTWEELPCGPALQGVDPGGSSAISSTASAACRLIRSPGNRSTWSPSPILPDSIPSRRRGPTCPRCRHLARLTMPSSWATSFTWSAAGRCAAAIPRTPSFSKTPWSSTCPVKVPDGKRLPAPPFQRRALAVAAIKGKVYVIGGLEEDGKVVKSVADLRPCQEDLDARARNCPAASFRGSHRRRSGWERSSTSAGSTACCIGSMKPETAGRSPASSPCPGSRTGSCRVSPATCSPSAATSPASPVRFVESISITGLAEAGPKVVSLAGRLRDRGSPGAGRRPRVVVALRRRRKPDAPSRMRSRRRTSFVTQSRFRWAPWKPSHCPRFRSRGNRPSSSSTEAGRKSTVYLLGGIGPDGDVSRTLGDAFRFEAGSSQWTKLSNVIPDSRGMFRAALHEGAIWIFGGNIWDGRPESPGLDADRGPSLGPRAATRPASSRTGKQLPRPRRSFAGAVLGKKFYLVGGLGADMKIVSAVDVFDFESGQWSSIAAPEPRLFGELAELGGKLYLAGGYVATKAGHFEPAESIEVYDPANGAWSTVLDSLPVPRGDLKLRSVQGRLLVFRNGPRETGTLPPGLVVP